MFLFSSFLLIYFTLVASIFSYILVIIEWLAVPYKGSWQVYREVVFLL